MNNQDKYFKGQQMYEEFICFFRHHWITLIREFVYFAIFTAVIIFIISYINVLISVAQKTPELQVFFVMGFLLGTIYIHRFFIRLFNHFVNIGIITDMRIIDHKKTLFFKDTTDAIDMTNIQNIEQKGEGLLPNLLGYGDINIYLSASSTVKVFRGVPNAKFHFRCISRQKELRRILVETGEMDRKFENSDAIDQQRQILLQDFKGFKQPEVAD